MKIAIVGGGWAGLSAAVHATVLGHQVTVFEAGKLLGGRSKVHRSRLPNDEPLKLDNGQHILIGAYTEVLRLMQLVGVPIATSLKRIPLTMRYPDGSGLTFGKLPPPWNVLSAVLIAKNWSWSDKFSLLGQTWRWKKNNFICDPEKTVADLCEKISHRAINEFIEPICLSALNTPMIEASGSIFLQTLKTAVMLSANSSDLLIPCVDLSELFPNPANLWLEKQGGTVKTDIRVNKILRLDKSWIIENEDFDAVVIAAPVNEAIKLLKNTQADSAWHTQSHLWCHEANLLKHNEIATVYAYEKNARLHSPIVALPKTSQPLAQFAIDRGQLGWTQGLISFVISTNTMGKEDLENAVILQGNQVLGMNLKPIQTIIEKRATFACLSNLKRPPTKISPTFMMCGDYVEGPYPATLEGAALSAIRAIDSL